MLSVYFPLSREGNIRLQRVGRQAVIVILNLVQDLVARSSEVKRAGCFRCAKRTKIKNNPAFNGVNNHCLRNNNKAGYCLSVKS